MRNSELSKTAYLLQINLGGEGWLTHLTATTDAQPYPKGPGQISQLTATILGIFWGTPFGLRTKYFRRLAQLVLDIDSVVLPQRNDK